MADINLGGSVGTSGTSILGKVTVHITGDADLTLTPTQYTNYSITVTSDGASTGPRQVIAPLVQGSFLVTNSTTEGYPILFIGPTGTGVSVPINVTAICASNGTNFVLPNANAAGSAPNFSVNDFTPGGEIISGQEGFAPVGTNAQFAPVGSVLGQIPSQPSQTIDGTYGTGSEPWRSGVWINMAGSVVRVQTHNKSIMRIPLDNNNFPTGNRGMTWDPVHNRLYLLDTGNFSTLAVLWVIDTTPTVDLSGNNIVSVPGVIHRFDLSSSVFPNTSGNGLTSLAFDGTFIWATSSGNSADFFRVDPTNGNVVVYPLPGSPVAGDIYFTKQFGSAPASVWITDASSPLLYRIDPSNANVTNTITLPAIGITMTSTHEFTTPAFSLLFVGINFTSDYFISVIDLVTFSIIESFATSFNYPNSLLAINDGVSIEIGNNPFIRFHSNTGGTSWDGSGASISYGISVGPTGSVFGFSAGSQFAFLRLITQSTTTIGSLSNATVHAAGPFLSYIDVTGQFMIAPDDGVSLLQALTFIGGSEIWQTAPRNPHIGAGSNTVLYPASDPFMNAAALQFGVLQFSFDMELNDKGSFTVINTEGAYGRTFINPTIYPNMISTTMGTNITPIDTLLNLSGFATTEPTIISSAHRNDVVVKSLIGTGGAGSYLTDTLYVVPSSVSNTSLYAFSLMVEVKLTVCGVDGYNSKGSWHYILDVANVGSPTLVFNYNPLGLSNPTFAWSGTSLSVTVPTSGVYLYWTAVTEATFIQTFFV